MRRRSRAAGLALAGAGVCTGAWMSANSLSASAPSSQIQAFAAVGRAPVAQPKPLLVGAEANHWFYTKRR
jgi:hypothetical protein